MKFDPHKHHRRSIRLKGYDYTQAGAYFITICVKGGLCLLGDVVDGSMHLNEFGQIILDCWNDLPNHYSHMELDAFVIMPNHIHGIIMLDDESHVGAGLKPAPTDEPPIVGAGLKPAPTNVGKRHGLPEIVRALKTFSARRINKLRDTTGSPFWQRNYYEHIIRNRSAYEAIQQYIYNNPANWLEDKLHPNAPPNKFNETWNTNR